MITAGTYYTGDFEVMDETTPSTNRGLKERAPQIGVGRTPPSFRFGGRDSIKSMIDTIGHKQILERRMAL